MRKFRRGATAFLLSSLVPGVGQVFNGQLLLGAVLLGFYVFVVFSAGIFGLPHAFPTLIFYVFVLWTFQLAVGIHAALAAIRQVSIGTTPRHGWRSYALGAILICIAVLIFQGNNFPDRILRVHAYKIPADSMSPTLVTGDRLIVDTWYYEVNHPKPGEVIVFKMPINDVLYIKRVIAIGGDTVAGDSKSTYVNGSRINEPYLLTDYTTKAEKGSEFGPVKIPANQLFVMGDNRDNSYDSRYFGTVDVNRVIGKALYIYYSSGKSNRIDRKIH